MVSKGRCFFNGWSSAHCRIYWSFRLFDYRSLVKVDASGRNTEELSFCRII